MPVTVHAETCRLSSEEFKRIAYEVMKHVFAVHNEFGRCFDEDVYQREIARRCGGLIEVPVEVVHADFRKLYFLDLLVANGAVFEIKTVAALTDRHRNQLLHYLLLTELPRGKLVNLRTATVQHEFVNAPLTLSDRTAFTTDDTLWDGGAPCAPELRDKCESLLRDIGTALSVALYEEAMIHLLGGEHVVRREVPILRDGEEINSQWLPLADARSGFRVTALNDKARRKFAAHLQRFLAHTPLQYLYWINIYRKKVTLSTLRA